jgi:acyl-CoA reductase-like NAD-dependent aldehyde dehydrogenase
VTRGYVRSAVVVLPYRDEDDAAALSNGTDYGLSAEVYSADRGHAGRFVRLDCGQVKINGVRTTIIRKSPSAAPSSPATGASWVLSGWPR